MITTNFTVQLAPGEDYIISADILRELGLHKEDPLMLVHIQQQEGDKWEGLEVQVKNIKISYSEDKEDPDILLLLIVEVLQKLELPEEGGKQDGKGKTDV